MGDWKSCDNCSRDLCSSRLDKGACGCWKPMPCPHCGGALSITREHNGKRYRHCYSCHSEFFEEVPDGNPQM